MMNWKLHPAIVALYSSEFFADIGEEDLDYRKDLEVFGPALAEALDPSKKYEVQCSEDDEPRPEDMVGMFGPWSSLNGRVISTGGSEYSSFRVIVRDGPRGPFADIELGANPATSGFYVYLFPSKE